MIQDPKSQRLLKVKKTSDWSINLNTWNDTEFDKDDYKVRIESPLTQKLAQEAVEPDPQLSDAQTRNQTITTLTN